jgi:hypothetical protein
MHGYNSTSLLMSFYIGLRVPTSLLKMTAENRNEIVRFQVLTAASMKLRIFRDLLSCS